jgi:hypothetical protein
MPAIVYLLLIAVAAGALFLALAPLIKAWWTSRGERLATCPETKEPVAVEIDPMDAAFQTLLKTREIHLQSCSHWPAKTGCGQECLSQIEAAPNGCLVHSFLVEWYEGKSCALCGKELPVDLENLDQHTPALMSPDRVTFEWADLRIEELPETLSTYQPICWDCHVVETLNRMHPELITEREPHKP